jgi:hypothetical protein
MLNPCIGFFSNVLGPNADKQKKRIQKRKELVKLRVNIGTTLCIIGVIELCIFVHYPPPYIPLCNHISCMELCIQPCNHQYCGCLGKMICGNGGMCGPLVSACYHLGSAVHGDETRSQPYIMSAFVKNQLFKTYSDSGLLRAAEG